MRYKTTTRIPFELPSSSKQDLSDAPKDSTEAAVAFYTDKRASNTLPPDIYTPTKKKLSQLANNLPTLA